MLSAIIRWNILHFISVDFIDNDIKSYLIQILMDDYK